MTRLDATGRDGTRRDTSLDRTRQDLFFVKNALLQSADLLRKWLRTNQISALERAHLENLCTSCEQAAEFFLKRAGTPLAPSTNTVVRDISNSTVRTTEQRPCHKRRAPIVNFAQLSQDADLEQLGRTLVADGLLDGSERDDVALWEYAEQAIRTAREPAKLFRWLIETHRQRLDLPVEELKRRRLSVWIEPAIQERAAARRRAWLFGERPGERDDVEEYAA